MRKTHTTVRRGSNEVKEYAGLIDRENKTVLTFWTVSQARAHTGGRQGADMSRKGLPFHPIPFHVEGPLYIDNVLIVSLPFRL